MTTTPNAPRPDDEERADESPATGGTEQSPQEGSPGAEIGVGEGSTFEPEEDAETPGDNRR